MSSLWSRAQNVRRAMFCEMCGDIMTRLLSLCYVRSPDAPAKATAGGIWAGNPGEGASDEAKERTSTGQPPDAIQTRQERGLVA